MHAVRVSCWDWHCASHGDVSFVLGVLLEVMTVERISELCDAYQGFLAREVMIVHDKKYRMHSNPANRDIIEFVHLKNKFRLDIVTSGHPSKIDET